jgi:hypothetical protein
MPVAFFPEAFGFTVIRSKHSFFPNSHSLNPNKMRGSLVARLMALGLALATGVAAANDAAYDSSLNFRPDNVTLNGLYHWVGS